MLQACVHTWVFVLFGGNFLAVSLLSYRGETVAAVSLLSSLADVCPLGTSAIVALLL